MEAVPGAGIAAGIESGLPAQLERSLARDADHAIVVDLVGGEAGEAGARIGVRRDRGAGLAGLGVDDPQRGGGAGAPGELERDDVVAGAADPRLAAQAGDLAAGPR